ncbi:hypothetical protein FIE12Z_5464 [Fusarium flagelliforme]|uniref:BTB domain-containing protein n=1 Tax=Fusarium flagelliforme TaxID=2675880 RepID=A0A395MQS1_9HYPO|nr:hypothetical protein FIE12Z_5464 [Fusarium flagelliforme]
MKDSDSTDALCASSLSSGLRKALIEGRYPDVTITCGNRDFKVHRLVVCTQSAWFDLAFTTPPKKRTIKNVEIKNVEPAVFQRFIEFLYTGTYTLDGDTPAQEVASLKAEEIEARLKHLPGCALPAAEPEPEQMQVDSPKRSVRRSTRLNSTTSSTGETPAPEQRQQHEKPPLQAIEMALKLYQVAVTYGVRALQLLTRDRFYIAGNGRWVTASWASYESTSEFEEILLDIYAIQDADPLWQAVIMMIKSKVERDEMKKRMKQMTIEHPDLTNCLVEHMLGTADEITHTCGRRARVLLLPWRLSLAGSSTISLLSRIGLLTDVRDATVREGAAPREAIAASAQEANPNMNVLGQLVAEQRAFVAGACWQPCRGDQVVSFGSQPLPGEPYA